MQSDFFRKTYEVRGVTETGSIIRHWTKATSPEEAIKITTIWFNALRWNETAVFRTAVEALEAPTAHLARVATY